MGILLRQVELQVGLLRNRWDTGRDTVQQIELQVGLLRNRWDTGRDTVQQVELQVGQLRNRWDTGRDTLATGRAAGWATAQVEIQVGILCR